MIKDLSEGLKSLINSLSLKPLATMSAVLIIALTYVGFRSYELLEKIVITPDQEAVRFKSQLESAELVNSSIENLTQETDAFNVVIRQFHNGRHDLTGLPFTESTITFYSNTVEGLKEQEPLSASNRTLRKVWSSIDSPQCVILREGIDPSTKRDFSEYSLSATIVCPLVNPLKYPIGTITVGFKEDSTNANYDLALKKTQIVAKSVTGYLQNASPSKEGIY